MPSLEQFIIGMPDGKYRTVNGYSLRQTARVYAVNLPAGSEFRIKQRGEGGWTYFTRTKVGIREISGE